MSLVHLVSLKVAWCILMVRFSMLLAGETFTWFVGLR